MHEDIMINEHELHLEELLQRPLLALPCCWIDDVSGLLGCWIPNIISSEVSPDDPFSNASDCPALNKLNWTQCMYMKV